MQLFDYPDSLPDWAQKLNRYAMMKTEYGAAGVPRESRRDRSDLAAKARRVDRPAR